MSLLPASLDAEDLASLLEDLADAIRSGDSAEGNVNWTTLDSDGQSFDVRALYRVGNLAGQGSVRVVGEFGPTD